MVLVYSRNGIPKALDALCCCLRRHQTEKCNKQASSRIKRRQRDKSNLDTIHNKLKDLTRIVWLVFRNKMYREKQECVSAVYRLPVDRVPTVANLFKVSVHNAESFLQKRRTRCLIRHSLYGQSALLNSEARMRATFFLLHLMAVYQNPSLSLSSLD
jgi:hypothetical protein